MSGWTSLRAPKKVPVSTNGLVSSVIVANDAIYAADRRDSIVKLSRESLKPVWRKTADNCIPVRLARSVLLVKKVGGAEAKALRRESGEVAWTKEAFGLQLWEERAVLLGATTLAVVNPETAEVLSTLATSDGRAGSGILCGDRLIRDAEDGPVRMYELATPRMVWQRDLMADMKASYGADEPNPVMGLAHGSLAGIFIATRGGFTFGCSVDDGRILWGRRAPVPHRVPNVHEGRVYIPNAERFICLDEVTGDVIYDVTHPELKGEAFHAKPGTIYGDTMAVAHESGHLPIFNLKDGSLAWFYFHKQAPLWSTAEADGRLFVGTGDGKLLVFAP